MWWRIRCLLGLHPWEWKSQQISTDRVMTVRDMYRCKRRECSHRVWRSANVEKLNRPW